MICPLAITLIGLSLSLFPEPFSELLQYHRVAINSGEWWRLLSAHLVHLGWGHLLMNMIGFWLIWHLFVSDRSPCWCLHILLPLMLGTSAGLWFFSPELSWYRGLSGALHGLLCWALLSRIGSEPVVSTSLLIVLAAKLAWEQWLGSIPGSESLASGPVAVDSHLYGAVSGVVLWGIAKIATMNRSGHKRD
jgi:rhomboid family GlyGly-CTERM serine protease